MNKIKSSGFRSLKETDWVNIHDLTAFIGENDGGKTTATHAIRLLLSKNSRPDTSDFTWETPDEGVRVNQIVIEAILVPSSSEKEAIDSFFNQDIQQIHLKRVFKSDGTLFFNIIKEVTIHEEFRIDLNKCTVEQLRALSSKSNINIMGATKKAEVIQVINDWLENEPKVLGETEFPGQLIELLPNVEYFSSSNSLNPEEVINNVLKILCKNELSSGKYSGQIKEIEEGVRQVLAGKVEELTPHIKKYYDEVSGVYIDPQFNISSGMGFVPLQLYKQGGGPIELQKKGDGKKRQVSLAIYEWSTEALKAQGSPGNLILIMDEPDTHMDYISQRKLFDIISTYVQTNIQVIICTHSLNLINRMPVNKINHFRLDEYGYTTVEHLKIEDHETESMFINEIGLSLGLDVGTMFHERCFLIVEGPTEMHALPQLFRIVYNKSMNAAGIKLINGENNIGVKNFAKFLHKNNKKVVFLLDSDCKSGSTRRNFTEEQLIRDGFDIDRQVVFIGNNEFEDSFHNRIYKQIGDDFYPEENGEKWDLELFMKFREEGKFSEKLQSVFRDGKPAIGYKIGKTIKSKEDLPAEILEIFTRANTLANMK